MNTTGDSDSTAPSPPRPVTFGGSATGGEEAPKLEGRLQVPQDGALHPGVVICHANPSAGGNMDMKLILALESALAARSVATLSYNSRGVGGSTGSITRVYDGALVGPEGEPEMEDAGAALAFLGLQKGVDDRRLALVGHSHGARISLAYLDIHPDDTRIRAVVCIGLGVAWRDLSHLGNWPHPKLFITGERDDFSPPSQLAEFVSQLTGPADMVTLMGTGHFFEGREEDMAQIAADFLSGALA